MPKCKRLKGEGGLKPFAWVANNSRATVGQSRSGESGKSSNLVQSGTLQSGNRAFGSVGPIGQVGQSGQSGKLTNRAIGQIGQLENQSWPTRRFGQPSTLPGCSLGQAAINLTRSVTLPDWATAELPDRLTARLVPDRYFPIEPVGQSSARLPDCY